ncbi:MAG: glycosyltransferase family 4 protein [Acidobacteriota bacterium]|nr:glycosyltransferase family 4 protein [Acidobacteriota bacterium]
MNTAPSLRVEALVSGRLAASSRFRVLQHVGPLQRFGIEVHAEPPRISKYASLPPAARRHPRFVRSAKVGLTAAKLAVRLPHVARSWRADLSWLEREVLPGSVTLETLLHRPLLFDVDDAIWLPSSAHERAARTVAARSACVMAGNDFLADWFSSVAPDVERVWTAVDTDRFTPGPAPEEFVVGWTGSGHTLRFIERLRAPLAHFLAVARDARLLVMADVAPDLSGLPGDRVDFVKWTAENEAAALRRLSVGIMPLRDSDWGRGKCAFKMLQYLACGVPAVVSPVGLGAEILAMGDVGLAARNDDEWVETLLALRAEPDRARRLGLAGRALVERRFSVPVIAGQIASCMRRHA